MSSQDHKKKTEDTIVKATLAPVGGVIDDVFHEVAAVTEEAVVVVEKTADVVEKTADVVEEAAGVVEEAARDVKNAARDVEEALHGVGVFHVVEKSTSQPATHTSINGAGKKGDSSYNVIGPGGNSGTVNIGRVK